MNSKQSTPVKVGVLPLFGAFEVKESEDGKTTVTGGFESDFLKMVFQSLNLAYEVRIPKEINWGFKTSNGSWTGLMGMVSGEEAEIAFGGILLTESRLEVVDYIYPYRFVQMPFATRLPEAIFHPLTFAHTFSTHLWISIISVLICILFLLKYMLSQDYSLQALSFKILSVVLEQNESFPVTKLSDRFIVGSLKLGVFVISVSYSSVLLAFLTLPVQEKAVKDIEALSNAVKNGEMKVFILEQSGLPQILVEHPDDRVRYLIDKVNKNDWFIKPDIDVLQKSFFEEKNALIEKDSTLRSLLGSRHFMVSEDIFCGFLQAVILRKKSKLKRRVDRIVNRIAASGIYEKNVNDYFFRKEYHGKDFRKNLEMTLTVKKLEGVFIVLLIGYLTSITVLLAEITYFNLKKKI